MSDARHIQAAATGAFTGRVGHKAGGFISKKFFHPSNFKNQELLWAAIEAKNEQEKRQDELMKKRDEERRIEVLKQEMYSSTGKSVSSSATGGGLFSNLATAVTAERIVPAAEKSAVNETKRRLDVLRSSKTSHTKALSYVEDLYEDGHTSVWGSWFSLETKEWGYQCCKQTEHHSVCSKKIKL